MWDYFHVCTKHKTSVRALLCPIFRLWLCCTWDTFISDGKNLQPWFPWCTCCSHQGVGYPCKSRACAVAAEHLALSFTGAAIPKGKRRVQAGAAVPVCQHAEDAAGSALLLCHPHTSTATLPWIPRVWAHPPWERATLRFEGWPQSPAANQSQGQPCCGVGLGMSQALDTQGMQQSQALVHCTFNQLCCLDSRMAVVTLTIKKSSIIAITALLHTGLFPGAHLNKKVRFTSW